MCGGLKITTQVKPVCSIPTQTKHFIPHSLPCRNIPRHAKENKKGKNKNKQKIIARNKLHHIWEGCDGREGTSYLARCISCYTFCHLPPALLHRSCVLNVFNVLRLYHSPTQKICNRTEWCRTLDARPLGLNEPDGSPAYCTVLVPRCPSGL